MEERPGRGPAPVPPRGQGAGGDGGAGTDRGRRASWPAAPASARGRTAGARSHCPEVRLMSEYGEAAMVLPDHRLGIGEAAVGVLQKLINTVHLAFAN